MITEHSTTAVMYTAVYVSLKFVDVLCVTGQPHPLRKVNRTSTASLPLVENSILGNIMMRIFTSKPVICEARAQHQRRPP